MSKVFLGFDPHGLKTSFSYVVKNALIEYCNKENISYTFDLDDDVKVAIVPSGIDFFTYYAAFKKRDIKVKVVAASSLADFMIKKDKNREPYDRSKIESGIIRACHKRPISASQISAIVDDIEAELFSRGEREISTQVIGELVMDKLRKLDPVAYVRFASVYREFKDVNTFMDEIRKFMENSQDDKDKKE